MSIDLRATIEDLIRGDVPISRSVAADVGTAIARGEAEPHQVAALLVLLAARGETADVVLGFVSALRSVMITVPNPGVGPLLDIVGTGGDGHNTVNISSAAAMLTAACGVHVAKHGSVSVSSRSGAADVLVALGIAPLPVSCAGACLRRAGITFLFAQDFHPALRAVAPVRKALRVRTLFNILGPLLNPAGAQRLVLGVYAPRLLRIFADAAAALGVERALIVHCCGLDELAPIGPCTTIDVAGGVAGPEFIVDPADWGVPRCDIADLAGGSPAENAQVLRKVLAGGADGKCAIGHTIALNAGAALYVYGTAGSVQEGYRIALDALLSGAGLRQLDKWAAVSHELAAAAAPVTT